MNQWVKKAICCEQRFPTDNLAKPLLLLLLLINSIDTLFDRLMPTLSNIKVLSKCFHYKFHQNHLYIAFYLSFAQRITSEINILKCIYCFLKWFNNISISIQIVHISFIDWMLFYSNYRRVTDCVVVSRGVYYRLMMIVDQTLTKPLIAIACQCDVRYE